jgi:hypothetical protein
MIGAALSRLYLGNLLLILPQTFCTSWCTSSTVVSTVIDHLVAKTALYDAVSIPCGRPRAGWDRDHIKPVDNTFEGQFYTLDGVVLAYSGASVHSMMTSPQREW